GWPEQEGRSMQRWCLALRAPAARRLRWPSRHRPEIAALGQPARPHHVVPIGPAIVWAAAYLLVASGDWSGAAAGMWTRPAGVALCLGRWYIQAAFLSSWLAMAAGLVVLHFRLRREFGGAIALLTCALTLGATTLACYV